MPETIEDLTETLARADDHTAMLMQQIERLEAALAKAVETDLAQRIEIESLKIRLGEDL